METLAKGPSSESGGNVNRLGEDVDPGLLLQSFKDKLVWAEGEGEILTLVSSTMGILEFWMN